MKVNIRKLASLGLGSLGSLLLYAAAKVKDYELSRVGEPYANYICETAGGFGGCREVPTSIVSLADAMQNIQGDYLLIGTALGLIGLAAYGLIKSNRSD